MAPIAHVPPAVDVHSLHDQSPTSWTTYVVADGDTLSQIALEHGTSTEALQARNAIADPNLLITGQTLQVPARNYGAQPASGTATTARKVAARALVTYRVKPGDILSQIALDHGTTVAALVKANKISDPDLLVAGQLLQVPTRIDVGSTTPVGGDSSSSATASNGATTNGTSTPTTSRSTTKRPTKVTKTTTVDQQAAASRQHLATTTVPGRAGIQQMIIATAQQYGVPTNLALAIGYQESGFNQRAVSPVNARGVMQIMPSAATFTSELAGRPLNVYDAQDNITAGVLLLRYNLSHATSMDQAIAGYYQGLGGVQQYGMYEDTKAYVRSVRSLMLQFS